MRNKEKWENSGNTLIHRGAQEQRAQEEQDKPGKTQENKEHKGTKQGGKGTADKT